MAYPFGLTRSADVADSDDKGAEEKEMPPVEEAGRVRQKTADLVNRERISPHYIDEPGDIEPDMVQ